ncbi:MAG: DegT/DnrJ/EryC1/StrS family aminotransferase [Pseudomonadota bacterium]
MIPVFKPVIGEKETRYVNDCLQANWISHDGNFNKLFEKGFSEFCETRYGISVTNGTTALQLALRALRIGPGDEVIVPDFTMASCGFAVAYCGAKPVFVDSERDTWNIDVTKIEEKISEKTKAIMVVHIFGHPCEMDGILSLCRKYGLLIIEDCAEAHGALYKGRKVGSFGDVAAFSFYANKVITTGEGGMVITNSETIAERARWLHSLAFDKERRFIHEEIGYNFRMTNLQAAIGLAQLERIDEIIEKKINIARTYTSYLSGIEGITLPVEKPYARNIYWMYGIVVENEFGMSMNQLKSELFRKGVDSRFFFTPLHSQPCFSHYGYDKNDFPVSIELSQKGFYLPSGTDLTDEEIEFVCSTIRQIQQK